MLDFTYIIVAAIGSVPPSVAAIASFAASRRTGNKVMEVSDRVGEVHTVLNSGLAQLLDTARQGGFEAGKREGPHGNA
jgi:hypothetical protein